MLVPWIESCETSAEQNSGPLLLALATVDGERTPRVRYVVCREIQMDGSLLITTDARSHKHGQLLANPKSEAACWLPATREQFRFAGTVQIVRSADPIRLEAWRKLSDSTRATFFWPHPGKARSPDADFPKQSDAPLPPDCFEVLLLHPTTVDRLQTAPQPHRRTIWSLDQVWTEVEVNP